MINSSTTGIAINNGRRQRPWGPMFANEWYE
jgi:hypothetical protein